MNPGPRDADALLAGFPRMLWAAAAGVFALMAALDARRMALWTYGADTGTFAQLIGDALGGMRDGIERGTHYRYHWSPALTLLWPLEAATRSAFALQLVQLAATVAVAPLVYALAVPRTDRGTALRLALLALIYPPLLALGWGEFHEIGLVTPLVAGALVAADRRRWSAFALCVVTACGLREDVALEFALAGIGLGIAGWRSRGAWFAAAGCGAAALAYYYAVIVPRAGGWMPAHFYVYPFAAGPAAVLGAPFVRPVAFVHEFATAGRLTYLLEVFAPLALLPLWSPWLLLALPGLAVVLLANTGLVYHMGNHYGALWIPWVLAATVFAAARRRSARRWTNAALACSATVLVAFNPLHPAHFLQPNYHDLTSARRALACVPPGASVATHDEWFTTIAARNPNATLGTIDGVDYLVYADDFPNAEFASVVRPALRREVTAGTYREICRFGAVITYRREKRGAHA